jgi:predicted O-methyltransferase YrrM
VRAARPRTIVETGVLYGASSAHLLAALARNGEGNLYSLEIGRRPEEPPHEYFVPDELRDRWRLIIGDSCLELPGLMARCAQVDMFYHDSLHTHDHMVWEFGTALPSLGPNGVLASDDVLNPTSVAGILRAGPFQSFCADRGIPFATFQSLGLAWPEQKAAARDRAA